MRVVVLRKGWRVKEYNLTTASINQLAVLIGDGWEIVNYKEVRL